MRYRIRLIVLSSEFSAQYLEVGTTYSFINQQILNVFSLDAGSYTSIYLQPSFYCPHSYPIHSIQVMPSSSFSLQIPIRIPMRLKPCFKSYLILLNWLGSFLSITLARMISLLTKNDANSFPLT